MVNINDLLCLTSEQTNQMVVEQALYLGALLDATVHFISRGDRIARVDDQIREVVDSQGSPPQVTVPDTTYVEAGYSSINDLKDYIHENDIDLVVTGTPSDRGAVPVMATDQTKTLVNEVECSLLVVNPNSDVRSWSHIAVPTDFSEDAHTALAGALDFAQYLDAEIDLVHVIETVPYVALTRVDRLSMSDISFPEHRARRQLKQFLGTTRETEIPVNTYFEYGDPADQISHFLNKCGTDLMVMSLPVPKKSGGQLGPVSDRILRRATCPLLLLRP